MSKIGLCFVILIFLGCDSLWNRGLVEDEFVDEPIIDVFEITRKHWNLCCRLCGHGKVKSAAYDYVNDEEICTCTDRVKVRIEPAKRGK